MRARIDAAVVLPDGRRLAYCEWGAPDGWPLFFFHGSPGSRLWIPDPALAERRGVRVVSVDRPGIGGSDVKPGRTVGDWPRDVEDLADALRIGTFAVLGYSSGGTYAAACAARLPERVREAAIVSTRYLGEYNFLERPEALEELDEDERELYDLARANPARAAQRAATREADWVNRLRESPESLWPGPAEQLAPEGDRAFWGDRDNRAAFYRDVASGFTQGPEAYSWELIDVFLPWGFNLSDITVRISLWYGRQDKRFQGRGEELLNWAASRIQSCEVIAWDDAGHLGIAKHWDAVLERLVPADRWWPAATSPERRLH